MAYYTEIIAIQGSPFDIGVDGNNRAMLSCNYTAKPTSQPAKFLEEMAKLLSNAGLSTSGTNLFIGQGTEIPDGNGPFILLLNTGGAGANETHNGGVYPNLSFQVVVFAGDSDSEGGYLRAMTKAVQCWNTLNGKRNVTIMI